MSDITVLRAAWLVPVASPPMRDAWVAVAGDRIVAIGHGGPPERLRLEATPVGGESRRTPTTVGPVDEPRPTRVIDLGEAAVMPGLVNAHTHLELSWLRGRVPPASSMTDWVRGLLQERARGADDRMAVERALDEAIAAGTVAFGDVANSLVSVPCLSDRAVDSVVFHEVLGFDPSAARDRMEAARARLDGLRPGPTVRLRLAPHAPYSTSAELFRAVASEASRDEWPPSSVHVAESVDEVRFLADGKGGWRALLEDLGALPAGWRPPGERPAAYLDRLGVWRPGTLAVHGVHLTGDELALLAERDVTLVTCPRSNEWVGAGRPPIQAFHDSGVRVAVGTDSLASAPDLNLFEELRTLRRLAPEVPARALLVWATLNGARALGLGDAYGSLEVGRRARLVAVTVPPGTQDVEETLVSGVEPAAIARIAPETLETVVGRALQARRLARSC